MKINFRKKIQSEKKEKGSVLLGALVFGTIAVIITSGLITWFGGTLKLLRDVEKREQAFQIAEAGIEYYRWHLAHDRDDYQDGTATSGPYIHDFLDKDGNKIGEFSLNIIPPALGSTVVTIESTGYVVPEINIQRTIRAQLAIPSFAKYAFVANENMRFGEGTEVFGPVHVNKGVRFDGFAHNIVSSALDKYDDPDHSGGNEFAVHTHVPPVDPLPPASVPNRPDVFQAGRQFPLPAVDFSGITADLSQMKTDAQSNGRYFSASGGVGYHVVLKTNDTFDLYRVNSYASTHSSCTNDFNEDGWSSWSIGSQTLLGNYSNPTNGIIFLEDHVWVSGQINTARITIAAGRFPDSPSTRRNIIVTNDVLYTNYDGQDTIALIAQNNINIGMISDDDLRIDGALIAQNGRVGRHHYRSEYGFWFWTYPGCSPYDVRNTITVNGMIGSNTRYGFAFTDNTGYTNRNLIYDGNLLYSPPPSFPLTSEQYEVISWEEIE